jgi:large subunit ribosomal protein L5
MQKHNLNNKLQKIVINTGVGRLSARPNFSDRVLPEIVKELSAITGQKPSLRIAQKSIAGFKLREGTVIGLKVTLRSLYMNAMLSKIINTALPRVRDFRGINTSAIDTNGNLNIGFKEHLVFPEISPEYSKVNFSFQVTFVPKNPIEDKSVAIEFYKKIGIPFKK